jgi:polysaccharide biosynthesis transport protein
LELRDYFGVLRRRWQVILLTTAIVGIIATALTLRGPRSYESTVRLAVSISTNRAAVGPDPYPHFADYYAWLSSEYLADDLSEIIKSDAFAADVATHLNEDVVRSQFREVVRPKKTHRLLEVTVQAGSPDSARRIASALVDVIRTQGPKYLAQMDQSGAKIVAIDTPTARAATTTGSQYLDIALRGSFGILFGLFLAFLVDYFDTRVRTARETERALGVPVLAEIPQEPR